MSNALFIHAIQLIFGEGFENMPKINKTLLAASLKLLFIAGGLSFGNTAQAAFAGFTWTLQDVTFADGGTASGSFSLNTYGYLSGASITTTNGTGDGFVGATYTAANAILNNANFPNTFLITFETANYQGALNFLFDYTLDSPRQVNPITLAASWECEGSYNCYLNSGGLSRNVTSGAAVPEPGVMGLLAIGLAGAAFVGRRSNRFGKTPSWGGAPNYLAM